MATYGQPLDHVLNRIHQTSPVSVTDYEEDGEWFLLESERLDDAVLFGLLKQRWPSIAGPHTASFALIHCCTGDDSGVWLHYLETPQDRGEYLPGCHQLGTW